MVQPFRGSDFTMIPRDSECCLRIAVCRWFVLPQSVLPNVVAMSNRLKSSGWGEAPAEITPQWLGRSLNLPSNDLIGKRRMQVSKGSYKTIQGRPAPESLLTIGKRLEAPIGKRDGAPSARRRCHKQKTSVRLGCPLKPSLKSWLFLRPY